MKEKEFAKEWVTNNKGKINSFPDDFLSSGKTEKIILPQKVLVLGSELFGTYEILDEHGNEELKVDDIYKAKFILYSNRTKPKYINCPIDVNEIKSVVKSYEKYLDELLEQIKKEFKSTFPDSKSFPEISNYIFNSLNLKRH
ncbi:MAG: hypothetical protein QY331_13980 [Melioribacteraceae bacterium]|jgi:hypothetical protein|nr:MAG: hypothetical protein QY331_13980 [Melioribacteraceae bacterium]